MMRIKSSQLVSMIILFQIGSSTLFMLGSEAKNNAWLSVTLAFAAGMLLLCFVYLPLHKSLPEANLIEMLHILLGKYLGFVAGLCFTVYFIYKSIRNVREFGDLMVLYMLPGTPLWVIMLVITLIGAFAIYKGIEVFFRLSELILPAVLLFYLLLFALLFISGLIDFKRLLPIAEDGWWIIVKTAVPTVLSFPFGEMVLFLMFWKHFNEKKYIFRLTFIGYSISGFIIIITNVLIITTLGALAGTAMIPLMFAASLIEIGGIIERVDPIVNILLFNGVFFKQTAYYLGAVIALSQLLRIKYRFAIIPVGVLIYAGSHVFNSHMQQISFGFEQNLIYHFPVFQIAIPGLLLILIGIRKLFGPSQSQPGQTTSNEVKAKHDRTEVERSEHEEQPSS